MEFLENVQRAIRPSSLPLHFTAVINAACDAHGRTTFGLLLHPLLDVASEKYVPTPLVGQVILKFLNNELIRFDSKGEQDCPVSDKDLLVWLEDATTFGQELMHSNNDLVAKVFVETGPVQMRPILKTLHKVLVRIEENRPSHIANEILRWHKNTFGWSKPKYYGEAVERIVHCVDMAIWLTWAPTFKRVSLNVRFNAVDKNMTSDSKPFSYNRAVLPGNAGGALVDRRMCRFTNRHRKKINNQL